jgi:phosphatidylglycerophosphate synthase
MNAGFTAAAEERPAFKDATRVLSSILSPLEKRTLHWLAARMPARVNSDHLTSLALLAMLGAGLSYWLASVTPLGLLLVVVCLAVNWFGDSLDGTLARVRQQQRPRYGYYVDHVLDIVGTAFLFAGLVLGGHVTPVLAMLLLAAYFAVMAEVFLATAARGKFRLAFMGMGPTELRLVLGAGALALIRDPRVAIPGLGSFGLFDVGAAAATAGLTIAFLASGWRNGRALYAEEPLPVQTESPRRESPAGGFW